ncbi:hypothetical protein ACFLSK_03110 [Chloroflexota bacterium]
MSIQQIGALLFIYIILLFVFYTSVYILAWLLLRIYRLLRKIPWFARIVDKVCKTISRFWKTHFPTIVTYWDKIQSIYVDYLADLLFYGISLVIFVDRYQAFVEYSKQNPQYTVLHLFLRDMITDTFYLWAILFFILWILSKGWENKQNAKDKKTLSDSLSSIHETLEKLNKNISKLSRNLDKKERQ